MSKTLKKSLSLVLALVMCLSLCAFNVLADNDVATTYHAGDGTQSSPYQISNAAELALLAQQVNSDTTAASLTGKFFVLTDNIDLTGYTWTPIGDGGRNGKDVTGHAFRGTFNGNGHTITGLNVNRTSNENTDDARDLISAGLFGAIEDATITNLKIEAPAVSSYGNNTGALVGLAKNSTISYITVTGGSVTSHEAAGGIVGRIIGSGTVSNCSNSADVSATNGDSGDKVAGGIVGSMYRYASNANDLVITSCTNTGNIESAHDCAGGIVGFSWGCITDCTNTGNVNAYESAGGIVGEQRHGGTISGNKNYGTVTTTSNNRVGGIVGDVNYEAGDNTTPDNVTITGNTTTTGSAVGYTAVGTSGKTIGTDNNGTDATTYMLTLADETVGTANKHAGDPITMTVKVSDTDTNANTKFIYAAGKITFDKNLVQLQTVSIDDSKYASYESVNTTDANSTGSFEFEIRSQNSNNYFTATDGIVTMTFTVRDSIKDGTPLEQIARFDITDARAADVEDTAYDGKASGATGDKVNIQMAFTTTVTKNGTPDENAPVVAVYNNDYVYDTGITPTPITVSVKVGDTELAANQYTVLNGKITIPGAKITAPLTITVSELDVRVYQDYVSDWYEVQVRGTGTFMLDGKPMYKVTRGSDTYYSILVSYAEYGANKGVSDFASKVSFGTTTRGEIELPTLDVNKTGHNDYQDYLRVFVCYQKLVSFETYMEHYLRADYTGDHHVNTSDFTEVYNGINNLGPNSGD